MTPLQQRPPRRAVLVLDGELPQSLTVVRSLGRAGAAVYVGAGRADALAFKSRYCAGSVLLPSPTANALAYVDALVDFLTRQQTDMLVFPVSDRSLLPLVHYEDTIPNSVTIVRPPTAALEGAFSKAHTMTLADSLEIPIPPTTVVREEAEIAAALESIRSPHVIKPDRSFYVRHGRQLSAHSVRYGANAAESHGHIETMLPFGPVLVQGQVSGDGVGIGVLAEMGRIVSTFSWRRLHEVPITGGGSSYRISQPVDPVLLGYSAALLGALKWHGVAMVEFKQDADAVHLMEINGRFWGSLPLAVASGVDFPAMLYDLYSGHRVDPHPYRMGVRCRLLSRDIEWIVQATTMRRRGEPDAPTWRQILADTLRMWMPGDHFDVHDWRDPEPGWHDFKKIAAGIGGRLGKRIKFRPGP
jgi:predicted ATP-grasp superfamily ATP-dependent carboligase